MVGIVLVLKGKKLNIIELKYKCHNRVRNKSQMSNIFGAVGFSKIGIVTSGYSKEKETWT